MLSLHLLERGDTDGHNDRDRQPRQDDERRKSMDRPRYQWTRGVLFPYVFVAHADFSRQDVKAFTPSEILSALTSSSTMMRQPMPSLSPCATTLPTADVSAIANCNDHGRLAP